MSFKKPLFIADKLSGHQLAGDGGAHDGAGACDDVCQFVLVGMAWGGYHDSRNHEAFSYAPLGKKARPSINSFNPNRSWKIPVVLATTMLHIV